MRCPLCGWPLAGERCRCGSATGRQLPVLVPVGTKVLARQGRGVSMRRWDRGEVQGHVGRIHRVETCYGTYWCEGQDMLVEWPEREALLVPGARVWGLWVDGRWYPGTVDRAEGHLRHVQWDDGDSMWTEARNLVILAVPAGSPAVGDVVQATRWDGRVDHGVIEETEESRCRVVFSDDETAWVPADQVKPVPANPFVEAQGSAGEKNDPKGI
jgi:hypothetical protein